jgi:hypothetical protein
MADDRSGGIKQFMFRAEAGAMGGLIAAVAVAVLFFVQGAVEMHPFSVPLNLASGFFGDTTAVVGDLGRLRGNIVLGGELLGYTILHLLAFGVAGAGAVFVLSGTAFWPSVFGGALYGGLSCTGLLYVARWTAGTPVALDVIGLPKVLLVNGFAGLIIGASLYLAERSRRLDPEP